MEPGNWALPSSTPEHMSTPAVLFKKVPLLIKPVPANMLFPQSSKPHHMHMSHHLTATHAISPDYTCTLQLGWMAYIKAGDGSFRALVSVRKDEMERFECALALLFDSMPGMSLLQFA